MPRRPLEHQNSSKGQGSFASVQRLAFCQVMGKVMVDYPPFSCQVIIADLISQLLKFQAALIDMTGRNNCQPLTIPGAEA